MDGFIKGHLSLVNKVWDYTRLLSLLPGCMASISYFSNKPSATIAFCTGNITNV